MSIVKPVVELAHEYLARAVRPGDVVIDATAGNGWDTLKLASLVGPGGKVWAFDIQSAALAATKDRLAQAGLLDRVTLIGDNHCNLNKYVTSGVRAVVFNLGYLPGSSHDIATNPVDTLCGVEQSLSLLVDGGIVLITVYWGHAQGVAEKEALGEFLRRPALKSWQALCLSIPNREKSPFIILLEKKEEEKE